MKNCLITGGLGDFFAVDGLLSEQEKGCIESIYLATPAHALIQQALRLVPEAYPSLREINVLSEKVFLSKEGVVEAHGPIDAVDLSIHPLFASERTYQGSSFLKAGGAYSGPPDYVVIVPWTTSPNTTRRFHKHDWEAVADVPNKILLYAGPSEEMGCAGVINLANQTSLGESIAILRGAKAYIGISSALSVLAVKLLDRVLIKNSTFHCVKWLHRYYAPRTRYDFVTPNLTPGLVAKVIRT